MKRHHYFFLPVVAATVFLFWIVPGFPLAHLDDPSHWGVIGYVFTFAVIAGRMAGRVSADRERRVMVLFLLGMPVIYVANWLRFGGSGSWLLIELFGLLLFGAVAWLSTWRAAWLLPAGIAAHAVWDLAHYGATDFVPNWYVVGCLAVDAALALYIAGCQWRADRSSTLLNRSPSPPQ